MSSPAATGAAEERGSGVRYDIHWEDNRRGSKRVSGSRTTGGGAYDRRVTGHDRAEARSLAYHRVIAGCLRAGESDVRAARARVARWAEDGTVHPHYQRAWAELLARPLTELAAAMTDTRQEAVDLRQVSPFAGYLDARERWRIWRSVGLGGGEGAPP